jgi:hypothetical protein
VGLSATDAGPVALIDELDGGALVRWSSTAAFPIARFVPTDLNAGFGALFAVGASGDAGASTFASYIVSPTPAMPSFQHELTCSMGSMQPDSVAVGSAQAYSTFTFSGSCDVPTSHQASSALDFGELAHDWSHGGDLGPLPFFTRLPIEWVAASPMQVWVAYPDPQGLRLKGLMPNFQSSTAEEYPLGGCLDGGTFTSDLAPSPVGGVWVGGTRCELNGRFGVLQPLAGGNGDAFMLEIGPDPQTYKKLTIVGGSGNDSFSTVVVRGNDVFVALLHDAVVPLTPLGISSTTIPSGSALIQLPLTP